MTFLPIAERELRVAAQRRAVYLARVIPAAALFGISVLFLLPPVQYLLGASRAGQAEFGILKWLIFVPVCSIAGVAVSDAISGEKREGTLGLLFLTDLRGYDVVAGKFVSHLIPAFCALAAVFPILAIPLLAGGVTGTEFWRTTAVMANSLFLSLACGMLVSCFSRDATSAGVGTVMLLMLIICGPSLFDNVLGAEIFGFASPARLLENRAIAAREFWLWLAVQHFLGWWFLAVASRSVRHTWQNKITGPARLGSRIWMELGSRVPGTVAPRISSAGHPALCPTSADRSSGRIMWIFTLLMAWLCGAELATRGSSGIASELGFCWLGFMILFSASNHGVRPLLEGRRGGALEQILVTLVTPCEIVADRWRALRRTILWPATVLSSVYVISRFFALLLVSKHFSGHGVIRSNAGALAFVIFERLGDGISLVTGAAAVGWYGMWRGLNDGKVVTAVMKTFCFVIVLPEMVCLSLRAVMMACLSVSGDAVSAWLGMGTLFLLTVGKDALFISVARANLRDYFREAVSGDWGRYGFYKPRRLQPLSNIPTLAGLPAANV